MIVMKFGGTSVEDASAIKRVIGIIREKKSRNPLVVVSACAGVTNDLLRVARTVRDGNQKSALAILDAVRQRHRKILEGLVTGSEHERVSALLDEMFQDLRNIVRGVYLLGELTNRSLDAFTSFGERLSSVVIHAGMVEAGMKSVLIDAREVMATDSSYASAQPLMEKVRTKSHEVFKPHLDAGEVVVTQGFIGSAENGTTTTIGRGGSDLSAAIFGSALGVEEIQIWTDVDGMMTADPRIIPESKLITVMSFDEASELAYFGAKVLHPRTILPAIEKNIPVRVLNSRSPEVAGTLILHSVEAKATQKRDAGCIKSIAFKRDITVINVNSSRMLMAHGFLAKLFSIFAEHEKSVDVISTSEVSVSLTIDNEDGLPGLLKELELIGETRVKRMKAIVCVVGEGMRHIPGTGARIFGALAKAGVNIEMVSEGASEINLTLVVDDHDVDTAVRALHDEFFSEKQL